MAYITNHKNKSPETYPDPRGSGNGDGPFARNSATGPDNVTAISAGGGTQVPWNVIDSGAVGGVNIPITPLSTGVVRIQGVISIKNSANAVVDVHLEVQVDDVSLPVPFNEANTIQGSNATSFEAVPFMIVTTIPIGSTSNVQILLKASSADSLSVIAESSTIDIQEVPAATG